MVIANFKADINDDIIKAKKGERILLDESQAKILLHAEKVKET